MTSFMILYLVTVIFVGNCFDRVIGISSKDISLISAVHQYYKTSSVFFIISNDYQPHLDELYFDNTLYRIFSKNGVYTVTINYYNLPAITNFYQGRIVRPLMVVILKSENDVTEFNKNFQDIKAYPIWLLIFENESSDSICDYCNNPMGNVFNLQLNTEMLVVCCDNSMLKEWWSIHANRTEVADFAMWNEDEGLTFLKPEGLYSRRPSVDGAGFRFAVVTHSSLVDVNQDEIGGYLGTIVQELKRAMNFTIIETLKEMRYGSWSAAPKNWSGVVGQLAERKADLGIADFSMTTSRFDVVDFTFPLMISKNLLVIKIPDGSGVRWSSYIEVFKLEIWMSLVFLLIVTPLLLTVMKINRTSIPLPFLVMEHYLHVWGIFCQEGLSEFPAETPLRIAYLSMFISAIIISAAYSASLISYLTISTVNLPFSTLAGFAKDNTYKLIVVQNSSNYDLFATANDPTLMKMMTLMKPWKELPRSVEEGFAQVCKEKVAFYADEVVKQRSSIRCKIAEIETGRVDHLAMILSPKSQFTGIVNHHIQRFKDSGLLSRLKRRYFPKESSIEGSYSVVNFWGIVPILTVLAIGIILGAIVLICEKNYRSKQRNAQKMLQETIETQTPLDTEYTDLNHTRRISPKYTF